MSRRIRRRRFLGGMGAVAVTVGVAGCSNDSDDNEEDEDDDDDDTEATEGSPSGATDTMSEQPTDEPMDQTTEQPTTEPEGSVYRFSEGESYTYDASFGGTASEETWSVTAVDGDEVTVERTSVSDGETESQTVSGTHSTIFETVTEERTVSYFPLLGAATSYGRNRELTPGDTFTVETLGERSEWDSETVEVVGETTVNGVSCTELTATPNSSDAPDQVTTVCLADGYPFALSLSLSQDGSTLIEMTLTDATRP